MYDALNDPCQLGWLSGRSIAERKPLMMYSIFTWLMYAAMVRAHVTLSGPCVACLYTHMHLGTCMWLIKRAWIWHHVQWHCTHLMLWLMRNVKEPSTMWCGSWWNMIRAFPRPWPKQQHERDLKRLCCAQVFQHNNKYTMTALNMGWGILGKQWILSDALLFAALAKRPSEACVPE